MLDEMRLCCCMLEWHLYCTAGVTWLMKRSCAVACLSVYALACAFHSLAGWQVCRGSCDKAVVLPACASAKFHVRH